VKVSRDDLKALVKECLIELLRDGIGQVSGAGVAAEAVDRRVPARQQPRRGDRVVLSSSGPSKARSPAVDAAIKRESGGDSVMAEILADTANRTLPKMIAAESRGAMAQGGDAAALIVAEHEPEQIFGTDVTDKWSQLAFAQPKQKGAVRPGQ